MGVSDLRWLDEREEWPNPRELEDALHVRRAFDDGELPSLGSGGLAQLERQTHSRRVQEGDTAEIKRHAREADCPQLVDLLADPAGRGEIDLAIRAHAHDVALGLDVETERAIGTWMRRAHEPPLRTSIRDAVRAPMSKAELRRFKR
jgi:hypothetical protein